MIHCFLDLPGWALTHSFTTHCTALVPMETILLVNELR